MSFTDRSNLRQPPLGRRLRLGFVGGGRGGLVGSWHFSGARLSNHFDVVAGALSSRPDTAALSAADWVIQADRSYTDYREMARAEAARPDGIDAVAICTPNDSHAGVAIAFLEAGIDVILDKPMTAMLPDAEALVAVQQKTGVSLTMTYPFSHHAMVRQARALVDEGALGRIAQVHVEYLQDWNLAAQALDGAPWRQNPLRVGRSSIVGDIGTHAYHLLHTVTGLDVASLRADMFTCGGAKPQPDTAHIGLKLSNGAPATMQLSNAAIGQYCALRIRVWGDKGALDWDQEKPEELRFTPARAEERIFRRGAAQGIRPAAEALIHLPRGHGETLTDAWANLYAEAGLVIAARRSGRDLGQASTRLSGVADGLRGMNFVEACADSHEAGGIWTQMADRD